MKKQIVAVALLVWVESIIAAPRLDSVSVKVLSGKGNDVVISVSIERPTLLDLNCDALIDAGDGGRIPISWSIGDSRTKTARYEYKRAGSYRVKVAGSGKEGVVITNVEPAENPAVTSRAVPNRSSAFSINHSAAASQSSGAAGQGCSGARR